MSRIRPVMSKIGGGNGSDVRPPYPLKNLVISDKSDKSDKSGYVWKNIGKIRKSDFSQLSPFLAKFRKK